MTSGNHVRRVTADLARRLYRMLPFKWLEGRLIGGDCAVILDVPLILYVNEWVLFSEPDALLPTFHRYRTRPVYLLLKFTWYHEDPYHVGKIVDGLRRHLRRHPNHEVIFLANTDRQQSVLEAAGLRSVVVSSNALVNPALFHPIPGCEKRHDAIYDARILPFKRHHLASRVDSLALLTARHPRLHDEAHARSIRALLSRAHWYNDPLSPGYRSYSPAEVNACLNESRVGLCLSAEEGAMYASIQYLLAGLPVVSTASRGGRDVFFDPDYVHIVRDDPEEVAAGVARMRDCPVPPEEIRARTLRRMETHVSRLFELLDEITLREGRQVDLRASLHQWGVGRGHFWAGASAIADRIRQSRGHAAAATPASNR